MHPPSNAPDPVAPATAGAWLHLHGADAVAFAQAQFCSDVAAVPPGAWQFSAWLDAQGRVRAFFHLLRTAPDDLHLLLRGGDAAALVEPLRRFVFRSRLRIAAEAPTPSLLAAVAGMAGGFVLSDDCLRLQQGAVRLEVPLQGAALPAPEAALAEVRAGLPRLPAATLGELLPAWLDFERLGAISFRKGCYPGQEVAARMHFRGANSRHLQRVRVRGAQQDPAGQVIRREDGAEAGRLLQAVALDHGSWEALAVLRDGSTGGALWIDLPHRPDVEVLSALWRPAT